MKEENSPCVCQNMIVILFFYSHIELVGVRLEDVQFRFYQAVINNRYNPGLYGYHNKETFSFMLRTPCNYADEYLNIMKDVSLKYSDYIVKNLS